jgi:hypothetical protein
MRYGLGERLLGSDGTIEHIAGSTDMVSGASEEILRYYPEKANRPGGAPLNGESPDRNHMANWIDCIRSRKMPNAPVEKGYSSAVACHMANLAYRQKQRITFEQAKSAQQQF